MNETPKIDPDMGSMDDQPRRQVDEVLGAPADADATETVVPPKSRRQPGAPLAGRRVGPYRLLRLLGHGGMGTVYLARREDDYQQDVAIKLVRAGFLSELTQLRFRTERQALAKLDHPNIARLHDGGTTEEGLPYLVMEWIDGVPVDRYCDDRQLNVRQRLELFRQICAAVDHAHRNLLVHCDIKPLNVLVTADGTVKLLDFGIAKLLRQDEADEGTLTGASKRPMTPKYASPEQVLGEQITTATDVYALGTLLYELLCGRLPTRKSSPPDPDSHRFDALPEKPSRRLLRREGEDEDTPETVSWRRGVPLHEFRRQLRGDLDAIVLKAIRFEPDERYSSAEELSRDLGRYLSARPVAARGDSWRYRAGRLLRRVFFPPNPRQRRERLLWATALAVVVFGSWGVHYLRRPCGDSVVRLQGIWDAATKTEVHQAFMASNLPFAESAWRQVESLLDTWAGSWTTLHTKTCEATYLHREQSEQMLDVRMVCLDGRREELRALTRQLGAANRDLVINATDAIGQLGELSACADSVELSTLAPPPTDPAIRQRLADVSSVVEEQLVRHYIDQPVDFAALRQAVDGARELAYAPILARTLYVLGVAESYAGSDPTAGESHLEEGLLAAIEGGDRPLQTRIHAALIRNLTRQQGDTTKARFWRGFAEASLAALGAGHQQVEYEVYDSLGMFEWTSGNKTKAGEQYGKALAIAERDLNPYRLITTLNNLGMLRGESVYLDRAIEVSDREYGPDHIQTARPLANLAMSHAIQGRFGEALPRALRSLELQQATHGEGHPDTGYPLTLVGQLFNALGRSVEATPYLESALVLVEAKLGDKAILLAEIHQALADARLQAGRYEEALEHVWKADAIRRGSDQPPDAMDRPLQELLGSIQREAGDLASAVITHGRLQARLGEARGDYEGIRIRLAVGQTYLAAGHLTKARLLLEEALEMAAPGADRWSSSRVRFALARTLRSSDPRRARQLATEARAELAGDEPGYRRLASEIEEWLR